MTYVLSNLHGCTDQFGDLLLKINFSDNDVMYVLGDTLDIGEQPIELLCDLSMRYNVIHLLGDCELRAFRLLTALNDMLEGKTPDMEALGEMAAWMQDGGEKTIEGFKALDADMREGVLDYLTEMTLYEEANVKGKTYILMSRGIANYDADTDLEDYEPEDFFADDAEAPQIEDAIVVVGGEPTASGKIERDGNVIRINCGAKLACLCLESGKEFYV